MIPMISSLCQGSLGVSQLGRTWWKTLTRAVDLLDPDYPDNSGGLDAWCIEAMELDVDQVYAYLRQELPDYVTFEEWIRAQKQGQWPRAKVARFNEIILYRRHIRPHKIVETYGDIGFDVEVDTYTSALLLNTLQDWQLFYRKDFLGASSDIPAPMPPLVSSLDTGPLNVMQLPRTWYKHMLAAKGWLNEDYPPFSGGLDQGVCDALGLGRQETVAFIQTAQPSYLDFEQWVSTKIGAVDRAKVDAFEKRLVERTHAETKRAGIHQRTGCDPSITNGVLLNHLEDWRYAYDVAIAPRR